MIILIPKRNWKPFLEDLGKRRAAWPARIEVEGQTKGDGSAEADTKLNGITASDRSRGFVVDVSLARRSESAVHHSIENPVRIVYTVSHGKAGGMIEIQDFAGVKTRIHLEEPLRSFAQLGEGAVREPNLAVV